MTRTIGLLFDPHIDSGGRRGSESNEVTRKAIEKLNEVGVDWTIVGGDLRTLHYPRAGPSDWGGWDGDPENYYYKDDFRVAKEMFEEELDNGYYVIRGNNDRPVNVFREYFPEDEFPLWFCFEDDGARYVFLDSNPHEGYHPLTENQNFVSAPQISMLERLMDADSEIPTFVFIHAPLAKHTEIHYNWETELHGAYTPNLNYLSVQSVLERGNTVFVNSGHHFVPSGNNGIYANDRGSRIINDVEYVLARHLTIPGDPDYGGDVRWLNVDTESRSAEIKYYNVGNDNVGTLTETAW